MIVGQTEQYATKDDLSALERRVHAAIQALRDDMREFRREMREEVAQLRGEIARLRSDGLKLALGLTAVVCTVSALT